MRSFVPLLLALASIPVHAADEQIAAARQASALLIKTLGGELKTSMVNAGPEQTVAVCKDRAPRIAAEISKKTGMEIHRVSDRNRNPEALPDAWETSAIASLEKRLAAGEKPETLELSAIVESPKGKTFRYARALVTQPLCLTCHGTNIAPAVKTRITDEYPHDQATGYSVGMIRGIVSVKAEM